MKGMLIRLWWFTKGLFFIAFGVVFQAFFCGIIGVPAGFLLAMALRLDDKTAVFFGPAGFIFMLVLFNGLVAYYMKTGKYESIGKVGGEAGAVARAFFLIPIGARLIYQCFAEFNNPYKKIDALRLECIYCKETGKVEHLARATIAESCFVCRACGRSFRHDAVPDNVPRL